MKITLLTSDKERHNYFINLLTKNCDKLYVVQEVSKKTNNKVPDNYINSKILENYFDKVNIAQKKIFGINNLSILNKKNVKIFNTPAGNLNNISLTNLSDYLKSDIFIVFGCSYIKSDLVDFLIKKKAINIHMGVSPYYRGTDCNFWALYDNNPHLVGSTIHFLTKGLDSGPMLYHAMSNLKSNPFEYTMSTVKSAFHSLIEKIKNKSIFEMTPLYQDSTKEIRYSKKIDFNDKIAKEYLNKNINLNSKNFDYSLLKEPFFLDN